MIFGLLTFSYLVQHVLVFVVGLYELVLADPPTEADDIGDLVLLLVQSLRYHLVGLLPVALFVSPVGEKGLAESYGNSGDLFRREKGF